MTFDDFDEIAFSVHIDSKEEEIEDRNDESAKYEMELDDDKDSLWIQRIPKTWCGI